MSAPQGLAGGLRVATGADEDEAGSSEHAGSLTHDGFIGPRRLAKTLRRADLQPAFDADEAERVLDMIAEGCDPKNLPLGAINWRAVRSWVRRFPEFAVAYNEACEAAADRISWDTLAIADDLDEHPVSRSVRIKARQELAKVLNRRKYDPGTVIAAANATGGVRGMTTAELLDALAETGTPVIEHAPPGQAAPPAPPIFDGVGGSHTRVGPHPEIPATEK